MSLLENAREMAGDLARLRQDLHTEPELGLHLPRTQDKVLAALDGLPLEITTGDALSSVTAVLRGGRPGPAVLLRGDMDALPVTERTGVPYSSRFPERMHACGHDLHTTMLAGAARLLADRRQDLAGDVIFMFQPGEEGWEGAKVMIDEGVLDAAGERPIAAYGLHVLSTVLPGGLFTSRGGPMLAAGDALTVTVRGKGGHGSTPHLSVDPIPAACQMVTALQTLVTREFDVFDPVVVTVGAFHAGTAGNIIPDQAVLELTVRTFSDTNRAKIQKRIIELLMDTGAAYGLTVDAAFGRGYPVTVNDPEESAFAGDVVGDLLGADRYLIAPRPITGSEDFSYVLEEVPGAFIALGACPPHLDPATAPFNHSAEAMFDDAVLPDGAAIYAGLAERRLAMAE
ncbi:amidohydrolase [Spongiactinospora gelatinilytica]|uniref:Amidohydrolase n=1 Tax=Spongiactinospora gelatinilytica TaxID=2666298 RepID=A0A2W2GKR5_9ACTN|nr:M20 family metallopeptidase [Spongiactinospora gelatinilytica]PZG43199.1 amidohydrolase [Spongiactinospora gelatinilytica]